MPKRYKKKTGKYRGTRTCGGGDPKNRRGKGCKGGWGRAGMHKHRYTYVTKYEPDFFGKGAHGFVRYNKKRLPTINLYDIEKQIVNDEPYVFYGKVLGAGEITKPVEVRAFAFTETAKKKIEAVGGKAVILSIVSKVSKNDVGVNNTEKTGEVEER